MSEVVVEIQKSPEALELEQKKKLQEIIDAITVEISHEAADTRRLIDHIWTKIQDGDERLGLLEILNETIKTRNLQLDKLQRLLDTLMKSKQMGVSIDISVGEVKTPEDKKAFLKSL